MTTVTHETASKPKILKSLEGIETGGPQERGYIKLLSSETGGAFALAEMVVEPGFGPPYHVHSREDEVFIVHEGQVEFTVDGEKILAGAGDTVWAPRNVPHTFKIAGDSPARFTLMVTGSNFEAFFPKYVAALEAGDEARASQIADEHGIKFIG